MRNAGIFEDNGTPRLWELRFLLRVQSARFQSFKNCTTTVGSQHESGIARRSLNEALGCHGALPLGHVVPLRSGRFDLAPPSLRGRP